MKICSKCGKIFDNSWKICLYCKVDLDEDHGQYMEKQFADRKKAIEAPLYILLTMMINFPMLIIAWIGLGWSGGFGGQNGEILTNFYLNVFPIIGYVASLMLLCSLIILYLNKILKLKIFFIKMILISSFITLILYPIFPISLLLNIILFKKADIYNVITIFIYFLILCFNFYIGKLSIRKAILENS